MQSCVDLGVNQFAFGHLSSQPLFDRPQLGGVHINLFVFHTPSGFHSFCAVRKEVRNHLGRQARRRWTIGQVFELFGLKSSLFDQFPQCRKGGAASFAWPGMSPLNPAGRSMTRRPTAGRN
jgi:hypothetical protein